MSAGSLIGRDRLRARPERSLVRRQLEHLGHAGRAALAGHIGRDIEQAGTGFWTRGSHYRIAPSLFSSYLPLKRGRAGWGSAADKLAQASPPRTPTARCARYPPHSGGGSAKITAPYSG